MIKRLEKTLTFITNKVLLIIIGFEGNYLFCYRTKIITTDRFLFYLVGIIVNNNCPSKAINKLVNHD